MEEKAQTTTEEGAERGKQEKKEGQRRKRILFPCLLFRFNFVCSFFLRFDPSFLVFCCFLFLFPSFCCLLPCLSFFCSLFLGCVPFCVFLFFFLRFVAFFLLCPSLRSFFLPFVVFSILWFLFLLCPSFSSCFPRSAPSSVVVWTFSS